MTLACRRAEIFVGNVRMDSFDLARPSGSREEMRAHAIDQPANRGVVGPAEVVEAPQVARKQLIARMP